MNLTLPRNRLHIDVVTETYPPEINGVAHTISTLVQGLRKNNHHVFVIRPEQTSEKYSKDIKRYNHEFLVKSVPIPFYKELRMGLPAKDMLIKCWTTKRPDLVHVATEGPLGWSAVRAARELSLPITSDFRTNFHAYSSMYKIGFLEPMNLAYLRWIHNATDRTMVPTAKLKHELEARGVMNLKIMPRGVDTSIFSSTLRSQELRDSWGADHSDIVLLSVGRLAVEKNLGLLIRSYEAARAITPATKLIIVGDGPLRNSLEKQCPHAIFVGTKRGKDLAQHYASADAFVFPSLTETFGNVTIEAMASGLAVIAFRHAAAGDLIDSGHNGLTVEAKNEEAFIAAVIETIKNRKLLQKLGQAATHTASHHSWHSIIERTEDLFYEVIHAHKKNQDCHGKFIIPT